MDSGLVRTLQDHPDDAEAWLVFADSLLELGDDRGRLVHEWLSASTPQERIQLSVRAQREERPAVLGALQVTCPLSVHFGFIRDLTVVPGASGREIMGLAQNSSTLFLHSVTIRGTKSKIRGLLQLVQRPIRELSMSSLPDNSFFLRLPPMPHLTLLRLREVPEARTLHERFPKLRSLYVHRAGGFQDLSKLA